MTFISRTSLESWFLPTIWSAEFEWYVHAKAETAPKVRNATAWGNAPGNQPAILKRRRRDIKTDRCCTSALIPRLQRFDHNFDRYPGPLAQALASRAFGADRRS